ncbi:MAG: hypothetical protein IIB65_09450 [Proteobacteria bacterium]|nr:hypothetical protein [Pseudomonadota bacterium]MCH8095908.1 hypothetical protein [Pseudomonadota bacterium]
MQSSLSRQDSNFTLPARALPHRAIARELGFDGDKIDYEERKRTLSD